MNGLDRAPLPAGWNGALYPEDETPLLLDLSVYLPDIAPKGKSTLDLPVGRQEAVKPNALDDDEIIHHMLAAARKNPPPGSRLTDISDGLFTKVYRWPEAVRMIARGMLNAIRKMERQFRMEVEGLHLAGDNLRAPCVNGAVASGIADANDIIDRHEG